MSDCSEERLDSCQLGLLSDGTLCDEQRAARTTAEQLVDVEVVDLDSITSLSDISEYDVLWWHCARPNPTDALGAGTTEALKKYVTISGGLMLSLYALTAVDHLGIDPRTPDKIEDTRVPNHEWAHQQAGMLLKSRFEDSVVFDACEHGRVYTQPSASESAPRVAYDKLIPRNGEVLASAVVGENDRPSENTIVAWEPGDGRVLGVGQYLSFTELTPVYAKAVKTLLSGLVRYATGADAPAITGRPKSAEEIRAMRASLADDRHRPQYHFAPPANWLNDPNGLIRWDGTYHLYYQYNPGGPYHGSIHWGHATSEDLLHWEDHPVALTPDPDGPDEHGCWSGCAVDADGNPTFVYTGGSGGDQLPCLAEATEDSLDDLDKYPDNPIIEDPPSELDLLSNDAWNAEFRDHDIWRENGTWYHLIGTGIENEGGSVVLYTSENLYDWNLVGPILVGDAHQDGGMWECPELLRFGEYDVLQLSDYDNVVYFTGQFNGESFEPEHKGITDHGSYYAAQTIRDDTDGQNRHLSWGWIREDRTGEAQWNAGWSGVMSVPRELDVDEDGNLLVRPARELTRLREDHHALTETSVTPESPLPLDGLEGEAIEISVTFELTDAEAFELVVLESPDGDEKTPIRYTADDQLIIERESSSQLGDAATDPLQIEEVPETDGDQTHLRLFVDHSVLELFANERTGLSGRVYPTRPDSTGVSIGAVGGSVQVHDFEAWTLASTTETGHSQESLPPSTSL